MRCDIDVAFPSHLWLERVHGKHEVVSSSPTRTDILYGIEKP